MADSNYFDSHETREPEKRDTELPPTLPEPMMPMFMLIPFLSDLGLPVNQRLYWQI